MTTLDDRPAPGLAFADAIAHTLYPSRSTVKDHLAEAARATGARSTTHLVAIALRAGWIR